MTAHRAMLQGPAIDDNLTRLISRSLKCGGQRHLITRPGHVEVRYVLDAERDPDEHVGTLQSDPVDGVMHGLDKEVRLAGGVRWLSAAHGQGVWKCQRSAQSTVVTVTTMTGHVSTVTGHGSPIWGRFPRSNPPAEYRQAGEVAPMFSSRVPESSHLNTDLRLPRFHGGSRAAGKPGRTALL